MQKIHTQDERIARAHEVLPAGGFGGFYPGIVISQSQGSRVWDEDGREYVDYRIAKHRDPAVNARYNEVLRAHGGFKSPGKMYPSLAITETDIDLTQHAIKNALVADG